MMYLLTMLFLAFLFGSFVSSFLRSILFKVKVANIRLSLTLIPTMFTTSQPERHRTTESRDDSLHAPRKACWSLAHRGTLGETALHLCFLTNNKTMTEMAHALLELYPAMALDQYEGHEYRGKERSSIRSFFSQLRGYSVIRSLFKRL